MAKLKNRTQFTSTLTNENYAALKGLSEVSNIPLSKLLDMAVEALVADSLKKRSE
jgi:hypothetical protein